MGRFIRLLEENNPDASRYSANRGKYVIGDILEKEGVDVEIEDFHPFLYVTIDGAKYKVTVQEVPSGEEEENVNPNETITPEDEKAINMAKSLATKPKGGILGMGTPQGKIDKAYGEMMSKVSQKISNVARKIR
jgi:hypothetical protein